MRGSAESVSEGNGVVWSGRLGCTVDPRNPLRWFFNGCVEIALQWPASGSRSRSWNELSPKVRHGADCSGDARPSPSSTQFCQQIPSAENYSKD